MHRQDQGARARDGGELVNYRVVELSNGKYWFQTGVLKVKQEEADEKDEDGEKAAEEEVARSLRPRRSQAPNAPKVARSARRRLRRMLLQWQCRFHRCPIFGGR